MQRTRLGAVALLVVTACTLDTSGDGVGTGDGSSSGTGDPTTTSASTTGPTTSATSTATTTTTTTTTASTGTDDSSGTTASTGSESSTDPDTSATDSSSGGESSSSGEPPSDDYPACMADEDCEKPYSLCWPPDDFGTPNFCTLECASSDDCPVPSTGSAVPLCEGPPDQDVCVLDCEDGDCPTGMGCVDIFGDGNFMRCTRE